MNFRCTECSHATPKWAGRCAGCGSWGTLEETADAPSGTGASGRPRAAGRGLTALLPSSPAVPLPRIDPTVSRAVPTGVGELDRVLGGGIVPGAVALLAGEPGVGKSTLLLEVVHQWAQSDQGRALYVTGEESAGQVRLRAERTGTVDQDVLLAAESDLATLLGHVDQTGPTLLVVDSVQTMLAPEADGVTGGPTQVRAVTSVLTSLAKTRGIAVLLAGHVTKDGAVAGPRTLEHLVDVVLHFEGDKNSMLRMVRGVKNRFGAAEEVGCFELRDDGIVGISDPSGLFLHHRDAAVPGTAVTVTMDGKRPLIGELQALVAESALPQPRRAVSGLDSQRVAMGLAVLERRAGIGVGKNDVYAATVGGMRVTEPAADLALALAVASAARDRPVRDGVIALGEVGLAGEVRRVTGAGRRVAEAARLGFRTALVPPDSGRLPRDVRAVEVPDLHAALDAGLQPQ